MRSLLVAIPLLVLPACVTDDTDTDALAQADTEDGAPYPNVYCDGCVNDAVLDPVMIFTSYFGECHQPWEQPCNPVGYRLHVTCTGAPCTVDAPPSDDGWGTISTVTPLTPDPVTIRVWMNDVLVYTSPAFNAYVPDQITTQCLAGPSREPCGSGGLVPPVLLTFGLAYGDTPVELIGQGPWHITSDRPGHSPGNGLCDWLATGSATSNPTTVTVTWHALTSTLVLPILAPDPGELVDPVPAPAIEVE